MKARVDFITLRVEDLDAATSYYTDGLGWKRDPHGPRRGDVPPDRPGQVLALFIASGFDEDVGPEIQARIQCNLAHNVRARPRCARPWRAMVEAGATVVKEPQQDGLGRLHGIVIDVAGCCWEIAHNSGWSVADDGTVTIGPVE